METVPKYHTVGTVLKYHTVGTVPKYHTVGTVPKYNRKTVERSKIVTHIQIQNRYTHTNTKNVNTLLSIKKPMVSCTIKMHLINVHW